MKKMMLIALVLLSGCGDKGVFEDIAEPDQCLRAELFQACLKSLPSGPQVTKYNDWDEVVSSCQSTSYYQSLRGGSLIEPRCKAGK